MSRDDYRFIDKDPVIDVIRTEAQRYGNLGHDQLSKLAYESGVSISTLHNWFNGDTRRPQSLSTRFVLEALGVSIKYVREDGTSIRQPAAQMISKTEQEKILKREREREREKREGK
jgi:transcriptional regulator with XRE-family HTH domain